MSRAERLLRLMQCLRERRIPVSGAALSRELGISLRTLYRDIASLQAQGAVIEGEPGVGYVLKPGFVLPPLMFSDEEIEAIVLGSRWVAERTDSRLAAAARAAVAKISAVLPAELRHELEASALLIGPAGPSVEDDQVSAQIRDAIRHEHKLDIQYCDLQGQTTNRIIWPFALGYFDNARVVVAWCELRDGIRHFRVDRIAGLLELTTRYPKRRQALLKAWRESQGVSAQ